MRINIPSLLAAPLVMPGGTITGIDLAPGMVELAGEKARSRGIRNVSFGEGDAEELPFPDRSFDVVLCNHGLVHTTDHKKALQKMHRRNVSMKMRHFYKTFSVVLRHSHATVCLSTRHREAPSVSASFP